MSLNGKTKLMLEGRGHLLVPGTLAGVTSLSLALWQGSLPCPWHFCRGHLLVPGTLAGVTSLSLALWQTIPGTSYFVNIPMKTTFCRSFGYIFLLFGTDSAETKYTYLPINYLCIKNQRTFTVRFMMLAINCLLTSHNPAQSEG
jgi:type IV secretory pathway TrbD component